MNIIIMVLVIAVILALLLIYYYNHFVAQRNTAEQAFSTIDVMLQKRADLVPNLVATVNRFMQHEHETLTRISELRNMVRNSRGAMDARVAADAEMNRLIGNIMVQVERYPTLKADKGFNDLFESLESLEGQISASRRSYNAAVTHFNTTLEMFPGNLVAGLYRFRRKELLVATPEERKAPSVKKLFAE